MTTYSILLTEEIENYRTTVTSKAFRCNRNHRGMGQVNVQTSTRLKNVKEYDIIIYII